MSQRIYQVDAFTDAPFAGNPAAVCILAGPGDADWMQNLAREMNLSETAFLYPLEDGFSLRWFTPAVEVKLCGHATLASAHILWETGALEPAATARFHTLSCLLTADLLRDRPGGWIELNFPAEQVQPVDKPDGLDGALGVVGLPTVFAGQEAYLVEVDSEEQVRGLRPDFKILAAISNKRYIVTSRSDSEEFDFVSRFFAPSAGIDEDPVTGSAHCLLGPYWGAKLGRREMVGYQASARGGVVRVALSGDRVKLGGQAVTVLRGKLA